MPCHGVCVRGEGRGGDVLFSAELTWQQGLGQNCLTHHPAAVCRATPDQCETGSGGLLWRFCREHDAWSATTAASIHTLVSWAR